LTVACLAAELDGKYARVYGCLHDDLTQKQPSVPLVRELARLDPSFGPVDALLFPADAPVFRWQLVQFSGDGRGAALDPRILAFLLGKAHVDSRIRGFLRRPAACEADGSHEAQEAIERTLHARLDARHGRVLACVHGPGSADAERAVQRVCRELAMGLVHADLGELLRLSQAGALGFGDGLRRLYREALLQPAAVYLSGLDRVLDDPHAASYARQVEEMLREAPWFTCVESERLWVLESPLEEMAYLPFAMERPAYPARREAWRLTVGGAVSEDEVDALAARYRYTRREVGQTVGLARAHAEARDAALSYQDVVWACRARSSARLGPLARVVTPRAAWSDLVLPEDTVAQLREICAQVRQRARVLHEWGFDRRLSLGKGLYALFVGPSGTGKTLGAEVIAASLGLDLVKVDLAAVVSKYIGETEKNLERIFQGAGRSDAILFFDEADALFGRRSEIKDAHDRYANIEVSFLLQRLEEYEGFVILASNLAQNIDESFTRRMQFTVEFPFPNEPMRLAIWRNHFPNQTPVERDLDLAYMAREFKIAGGNIRKIVLNAAFLAADDGGTLGMMHLLRATRREYAQMGKLYPGGAS